MIKKKEEKMPKIRKKYEEIISILENNKDKKVSELLDEIRPMVLTKPGGKTPNYKLNAEGEMIAIFCSYHKKWEDPRIVVFGKKSTSKSGFTSYCLEGMNHWAIQRKEYKKGVIKILDMTIEKKWSAEHAAKERESLEKKKAFSHKREDGYGFEKLEDCLEHSRKLGLLI